MAVLFVGDLLWIFYPGRPSADLEAESLASGVDGGFTVAGVAASRVETRCLRVEARGADIVKGDGTGALVDEDLIGDGVKGVLDGEGVGRGGGRGRLRGLLALVILVGLAPDRVFEQGRVVVRAGRRAVTDLQQEERGLMCGGREGVEAGWCTMRTGVTTLLAQLTHARWMVRAARFLRRWKGSTAKGSKLAICL